MLVVTLTSIIVINVWRRCWWRWRWCSGIWKPNSQLFAISSNGTFKFNKGLASDIVYMKVNSWEIVVCTYNHWSKGKQECWGDWKNQNCTGMFVHVLYSFCMFPPHSKSNSKLQPNKGQNKIWALIRYLIEHIWKWLKK